MFSAPNSARRTPSGPGRLAQGGLHALQASSPTASSGGLELSQRRKTAIKKAFRRLDPNLSGAAPLADVLNVLASAPVNDAVKQELRGKFERVASPGQGGPGPVVSYAAFAQHYQATSAAVLCDSDFEQLLQSQWGFLQVSDILAAMQRHFTLVGLAEAFQGHVHGSQVGQMNVGEFEEGLRRVGMQLRSEDLRRVYSAFSSQQQSGGASAAFGIGDLKEELMSPRPSTPVPLTRDLPEDLMMGGVGPPGGGPAAGFGAPPGHAAMVPSGPSGVPAGVGHPGSEAGPPPGDQDLEDTLSRMEAHLHHLKTKKAAAPSSASAAPSTAPGQSAPASGAKLKEAQGPVSDDDLDAMLAKMDSHLKHIKAHKPISQQHSTAPDPPPVEMPHWEHHKYGHHKITEAAWKPEAKVQDMYGQQHASSEYHYNNYGAGSHGHHLAHFHLNDYHGLPHHSFKPEEYHRQTYGDAAHHGHSVPHLHGMGTKSHQGEHSYAADDYHRQAHGKPGHHGHFVPHLHGMGGGGSHP